MEQRSRSKGAHRFDRHRNVAARASGILDEVITVFICYIIDPHNVAAFEQYAKRWLELIPKCGGDLVGYFLPHEGTNNTAYGLIRFESLAAYEGYRTRLKADPESAANFAFAARERFILSETRTFLRQVSSV